MPPGIATRRDGGVALALNSERGLAWHKLGNMIDGEFADSKTFVVASGLDHDVVKQPVYTVFNGKPVEVPRTYAMVRDYDGMVLATVGERYVPLQAREAFDGMDGWLRNGRLTYEAAMLLDGGRRFAILARLGDDFLVGGRDPVTPYVLLFTSHDGTAAVTIKLVNTRVVCQNTLAVALGELTTETQIRHTRTVHEKLERATEKLDLMARTNVAEFAAFDMLAQMNASDEEFEDVVSIVLPRPSADASDLVQQRFALEQASVRQHFLTSPTVESAGGIGTRWGLFNAATEWMEHVEVRKGQRLGTMIEGSDEWKQALERRARYAFDGFGADFRQRVFDRLTRGVDLPALAK